MARTNTLLPAMLTFFQLPEAIFPAIKQCCKTLQISSPLMTMASLLPRFQPPFRKKTRVVGPFIKGCTIFYQVCVHHFYLEAGSTSILKKSLCIHEIIIETMYPLDSNFM
jgi:hypothetical protein